MAAEKDVLTQNNQYELDFMGATPVYMTTSKLDADQYMAEDLDGVTESVFGAGNMGYASLQAAQSDILMTQDGFLKEDGAQLDTAITAAPSTQAYVIGQAVDVFEPKITAEETITNYDESQSSIEGTNAADTGEVGGLTAATIGSIKASELSSNEGVFAPSGSGLSLADTVQSSAAEEGQNGENGHSGHNGMNGSDGKEADCENTCDQFITINNIDINIADVTVLIEQTFIGLNDVLENLNITITEVTDVLGDIVSNVLNQTTNLTSDSLTTASELLEVVTGDLISVLKVTLNNIGEISQEVIGVVEQSLENISTDILQPAGDASLSVVNNVLDQLDGADLLGDKLGDIGGAVHNLKTILGDVKESLIKADIQDGLQDIITKVTGTLEILETVTDKTVDIVDGAVGTVLADLGVDNILGDDNANADGDLNLDIDLDILATDLAYLELGPVLDPVEDVVGDVDLGIDLETDFLNPGGSETDNTQGDSDINLAGDVDVLDSDILDLANELELDPVEDIIGDIDLDVGAAIDILGDAADPLLDSAEGGSAEDTLLGDVGEAIADVADAILPELNTDDESDDDIVIEVDVDLLGISDELDTEVTIDPVEDLTNDIDITLHVDIDDVVDLSGTTDMTENITDSNNSGGWTESTISDSVSLFDQFSDPTHEADILPDPSGSLAEGLGVLDITPDLDTGSLGGLFG